jgi:hypothetical protein
MHSHMLDLDVVNLNFVVDVVAFVEALVEHIAESKFGHAARNTFEIVSAAAETPAFHLDRAREAAVEEEASLMVLECVAMG